MERSHGFIVAAGLLMTCTLGELAHAGGRPDSSNRDWFGQWNGGWNFASGDAGDALDDGWSLGGGALYWPSESPIGLSLEANYWRMDLSNSAIRRINDAINQDPNNDGEITGGDVENWRFAVNGIWSLGSDTSRGLYLTGGISYNNVSGVVTETGLVYYPPVCDPWLWWCSPGGVGPGQIIAGKRSEQEFGWNVGAGYSFETDIGQVYMELRYEQISFGDSDIEYIPLTVGVRW
jgi:opacity protein-like surface antigen